MSPKDRLDRIEHMILSRNIHSDDGELFQLLLEELRLLREKTDQWERFLGSLKESFR